MITIVEIIQEARQGMTRPYLCRADDGHEYWVKRVNAGRKALIAEWLAGRLGQMLGLPVPAFTLAEVPGALLRLLPPEQRLEWGEEPLFASRVVPNAVEIRFTDLAQVPRHQQAEILLFDTWIGNSDRTLGPLGGNPNLLWCDHGRSLHMIDHNLAFESAPSEVRADHVFAEANREWDVIFFSGWAQRMAGTLDHLGSLWDELPEQWIEECAGRISLEQVRNRLQLITDLRNPAWTCS